MRSNASQIFGKVRFFSAAVLHRYPKDILPTLSITRCLQQGCFEDVHIGPSDMDAKLMLQSLNFESLDHLTSTVVPKSIASKRILDLPTPLSEYEMLKELQHIASMNKVYKSYIGMGYYDCVVPAVIRRNMLENAGWITQYTPYQAEVSQGRLECLLNFQTMICDLTGLSVSNASLLDESTACAEAMTMAVRYTKRSTLLVDQYLHPQNKALLETRSRPLSINLREITAGRPEFDENIAAFIIQYPNTEGNIIDLKGIIDEARSNKSLVILICDLLSLTLLRSPGELKADIAVGSSQRFGVPLGFGGPSAAFLAVREDDSRSPLSRAMPGRMVGVSKGANGEVAYRLTWQTREQHIRRDKATSNICTAQALLANMAVTYAILHGPNRLRCIATNINKGAVYLADYLRRSNNEVIHEAFFDTLKIRTPDIELVKKRSAEKFTNFRYYSDGCVGLSLDETTGYEDLSDLLYIFCDQKKNACDIEQEIAKTDEILSKNEIHSRKTTFLTHPVFNSYHNEAELVRYLKRLENKDISLVHSMIPLGSCTMKLNASAELTPASWKEFNGLHPFGPQSQSVGYQKLLFDLQSWLCEITGYDEISLQPNSGANGEYAGLMAIRGYLHSIGQHHRNVCLIPKSAHGTNPATAQMCNMKIVVVNSDINGNICFKDLSEKVKENSDNLAAIMITYPSTHGVFEPNIVEVCSLMHENGGQVYLDGANLNAQVGLCRPGDYGGDVSHINLHKTFCIPHGGGGPGVGPIGVKSHLAPFLPGHPVIPVAGRCSGAVSAAPYGSSSILPITWAYIKLLGSSGLKKASQTAILNANYMAHRLKFAYPILYTDEHGYVAHEFIIDCRGFKNSSGIEAVDIAKRLMDYGFHSPTMSFPVSGCLMIEPTESESKREIDRYIDSLISIREEIADIELGKLDKEINPLKLAPHTISTVSSTKWDRPYSRELAAFPRPWCHGKLWPNVSRIDENYGDRNMICSCPPISTYQ